MDEHGDDSMDKVLSINSAKKYHVEDAVIADDSISYVRLSLWNFFADSKVHNVEKNEEEAN